MVSSPSMQSPLARLVLFMVCLSIAGTVMAGAHYLAVDLPAQEYRQAPLNTNSCHSDCETMKRHCDNLPWYQQPTCMILYSSCCK